MSSSPYGIGTPGHAVEIAATLNREINASLADPKMKARLAEMGRHRGAGSPRLTSGTVHRRETEKVG